MNAMSTFFAHLEKVQQIHYRPGISILGRACHLEIKRCYSTATVRLLMKHLSKMGGIL